jgi:hypothetical protein
LGAIPPLGPPSFHSRSGTRQEARRPRRARRCLLKDCERWFIPSHPQSRYCCHACAAAARRWRRTKASRRYRATAKGRQHRRQQHCRYRQRARQRAAASVDEAVTREGQRPACDHHDFCERMCDRPGCYVTFTVRHELSCQRFCSLACRLALRRVRQREERYRHRRRRWRRQRLSRRRPRPDTS